MARTNLQMIGPMDSYCWYDPITDELKVRIRMECREKFGPTYYKSVLCAINPNKLVTIAEGMQAMEKQADRWSLEEEEPETAIDLSKQLVTDDVPF